ncbi:TetR/AcrR family transcriptional regulator [Halosquirtibacter laminarini]|uniref:TetR/AcrR family transcriptional regulator n=1 Tax=Halosquirtibacter laminarini TaxID=3374600 RepID=A0AC61NJR2_9BACT|nr:TetR/AcrR family transcriptional regulator [Prolixibacteraceae bacterium]
MQIKKAEQRNNIIEAACQEFYSNGFKGSSMRNIAQNADVSLSNIYNYFKNKDEILIQILKPLMTEITSMLGEHNDSSKLDTTVFYLDSFIEEGADYYMNLVTMYKKELKLLLCDCEGSLYESFREDFIGLQCDIGRAYLKEMKQKYPDINANISSLFVRNISSWFVEILSELVCNDYPLDKMRTFFEEYVLFSTAGWKKIMNI